MVDSLIPLFTTPFFLHPNRSCWDFLSQKLQVRSLTLFHVSDILSVLGIGILIDIISNFDCQCFDQCHGPCVIDIGGSASKLIDATVVMVATCGYCTLFKARSLFLLALLDVTARKLQAFPQPIASMYGIFTYI